MIGEQCSADEELRDLMDAYWRAANYLSVGQIYLLRQSAAQGSRWRSEHVKPRLLGHWGTTPGLNFILRPSEPRHQEVRPRHDLRHRPRHGGPGARGDTRTLEGTYSEVYPNISAGRGGMKRLFKQFSFPGGIPSHVAPETPGSIHEGGELGYALSHAFGAAFDNPDLIVACVVGDGEAETGPLGDELALQQIPEPGTRRRRAADPAPQRLQDRQSRRVLARISHEELEHLLRGYGYTPLFRRGPRAGEDAPAHGRHPRRRHRRDPAHPGRRARQWRQGAPPLADDRAAHPQGLDRPEGDRRQAQSRATGAPIRCRWARCRQARAT